MQPLMGSQKQKTLIDFAIMREYNFSRLMRMRLT